MAQFLSRLSASKCTMWSDVVLFAQPCLFGVLGICLPLNRQRPDYYHPDQSSFRRYCTETNGIDHAGALEISSPHQNWLWMIDHPLHLGPAGPGLKAQGTSRQGFRRSQARRFSGKATAPIRKDAFITTGCWQRAEYR
ncbi:hypothetical protein ASPCAL14554 [Aspergillus calidoustus]|uniref:Uncharacterized protein n=1 Tax=Aspergillus calidoustus TaxID=454130 RepID=A0A0U5CK16_ASPCI|nr:hypothetical protein ASPCAL14554 [Aspergillus calidoustus]